MDGHVQLIIGPMFSGKSTELLRRINRYNISKYNCIFVKYINDIRYNNNNITTHDQINSKLPVIKTKNLTKILDTLIKYDIIGIDEGQFFEDITIISSQLANLNKIVVIAALDATFERKPFMNIISLIPLAERVNKLNAICMKCFKDNALFTQRLTKEIEIEVIGGSEKYWAVCRFCKT